MICGGCIPDIPALTRRDFLGAAGAGVALATAAGSLAARPAQAQSYAGPADPLTPDEALQRLLDGNARYVADSGRNQDFSKERAARAEAQHPLAAILSCADSRLAPEIAFDQGLGDLFVVRLAGNFVNDDGLASLEFGTQVLGIPLILVLGHTGCGAVAATIQVVEEGAELPGRLSGLAEALRPGIETALATQPVDPLAAATIENVRHNVTKLETAEPIVSALVAEGRVKVVGGIYDIGTGEVTLI